MSIFDEPKFDTHAHLTDPARFPYGKHIAYHPSGQEVGTVVHLRAMMETYGIQKTLLVQPNSGYGEDNSAMLDAIAQYPDDLSGIAIVPLNADGASLRDLKAQGVHGVAFNPTMYGTDFYAQSAPVLERLADLDMVLNIQVEHDQIAMFRPWIEDIPVRVLIDHCGRPTPGDGTAQAGFRTILDLAGTGRVWVKLSGYAKFARTPYPFEDCWPFVRALVDEFTLDRCLWASDWPYLRAPDRQDVGPLLRLVERLFPDSEDRARLFWTTPNALLRP